MSIFRDSFDPIIRAQLLARGEAIKERTPEGVQFFNGRNAWTKLTSGVDVNGSTLAIENVLFGGRIGKSRELQAGLKSVIAESNSSYGQNQGAYSNENLGINGEAVKLQTGIRPMPGITSVEVQSKSAYGSVRVATVNFVCHDIKQLEILELLYMRPGFLCLIEWGWAPYLTNEGKLSSELDFYRDIWQKNDNKKPITLQSRFAVLYNKAKEYYGNYDALLGYIKNYEWSARMDGSFDCRTEIISVGEIIESLKVNYAPVDSIISDQGTLLRKTPFTKYENGEPLNQTVKKYGTKIEDFTQKNLLSGIISELIYFGFSTNNGKTDDSNIDINKAFAKNDTGSLNKAKDGHAWEIVDDGSITGINNHVLNFFKIAIDTKDGESTKDQKDIINDKNQVFLDLESFLLILNQNIIPHDKITGQPLIPLSLKDREYTSTSSINKDLLCLSHPLQISVDPTVCLIKSDNFKNFDKIKTEYNRPDTIFPNDNKLTNRKNAYSAIVQYVNFSKQDHTNEKETINVLNNYFKVAKDTRIPFAEASGYLADAFEEYKQKNLTILRKIEYDGNIPKKDHVTYDIGNGFIYEKASENINQPSDKDREKINEAKKLINKTFSNILIRDLSNDDSSLQNFINQQFPNNPVSTEAQILDFTNKYFTANSIIQGAAQESLRKQLEVEEINNTNKTIQQKAINNLTFLNKLQLPFFYTSASGKEFGYIKGIYINLSYALYLSSNTQLESSDVKEKKEINLYDYLKSLMKAVQESIGNLNDFQIHVDPIDNIARIIDINYIDEVKTQDAFDNCFVFLSNNNENYNGLFNNLRSYRMHSQIFKEQSTIVAISAQNGGGEMGLDNETLVGWNTGITNRLLPDVGAPNSPSSISDKTEILSNLTANLSIIKNLLSNLGWLDSEKNFGVSIIDLKASKKYASTESERYKNALKDLITEFKSLLRHTSKNKAPIPTKLSIEMDGIGGLIIGHIFRMPNELVPMGYKAENGIGRKLGYMITGINHSITNDWVTKLESQMIILEDPEGGTEDFLDLLNSTSVTNKVTFSSEEDISGIKLKITTGTSKTSYSELPFVQGVERIYTKAQMVSEIKSAASDFPKEIQKAIWVVSRIENSGRSFNYNAWGVQTDGARWTDPEKAIINQMSLREGLTGNFRSFAGFDSLRKAIRFVGYAFKRKNISSSNPNITEAYARSWVGHSVSAILVNSLLKEADIYFK